MCFNGFQSQVYHSEIRNTRVYLELCRNRLSAIQYTYLLTYGAEPVLRRSQLCSYSRNSQHFMEPERSLPCSQESFTDPYPEPDQSNRYHPILCKIHFNIVYPPTPYYKGYFIKVLHIRVTLENLLVSSV
jgi:hypothetical protein